MADRDAGPAAPSAAADMAATPYDAIAYPTAIFNQTQPDRMATIARLAGLSPPPVERARVLEIGGGDGMNLLALAAAYPQAHFTGFDLAATAVARGRKWIAATGAVNITLLTCDILDAAATLDGAFDYIIAHGVYAWVPAPVREATVALIAAKLAPDGVAFVSYNAMPGGYIRLAIRDALNFALEELDGATRSEAARAHLAVLAEAPDGAENPAQAAFRDAARLTLDKPWAVLGHDELGPHFHPQSLGDVVNAAHAVGLTFLGDADRERIGDAFLPDDAASEADPGAQLVRLLRAQDYREFRFFRQTLLVRSSTRPSRRLDLDALGHLQVSSRAVAAGADTFRLDDNVFEVTDSGLAAALSALIAAYPARLRVADIVDGDARRSAIFQLFNVGVIDLATVPAPYAAAPGPMPATSALIRMMIADHMPVICRLDQRLMAIVDHGPRHLLAHLDGSRSREALAEIGREAGLDTAEALERALTTLARECVLVA